MSKTLPQDLEQLIRTCGEDWLIDSFHPREQAVDVLHKALHGATEEAGRRGLALPFQESDLIAQYEQHPFQVDAFLQALGVTRNPVMLVMVWRILQGATISSVTLQYENMQSFHLRVALTSPYGEGEPEEYESRSVNDAGLLRHFGIMTVDGQPVFDGFYALRLGGQD